MTDRDDPTAEPEEVPVASSDDGAERRKRPAGTGRTRDSDSPDHGSDRARRGGGDAPNLTFRAGRKPVAPPEPALARPGHNDGTARGHGGGDDAVPAAGEAEPRPTAGPEGATDGPVRHDHDPLSGTAHGPDPAPPPAAASRADTSAPAREPGGGPDGAAGRARAPGAGKGNLADEIEARKEIKIVEVSKPAGPARVRRRHRGVAAAFVLMVLLPLAVAAWYLYTRAVDQYASTVAFTVRSSETAPVFPTDVGLDLLGNSGSADADIIYEFLQSRAIVERVVGKIDFEALFALHHEQDPYFSLAPGAGLEDLADYWNRILSISYEQASGLMEIRVLAFDPQTAKRVAEAVVEESQILINELNNAARQDAIQFAQVELDEAVERRKSARQAILDFQITNQIVNPERDIEIQLGTLVTYNQQLANAQVELDLLLQSTSLNDPRVLQAQNRIAVIQGLIEDERRRLAQVGGSSDGGPDYPRLIAEFESLEVDLEYAEEVYRAALGALDNARIEANRQSRYLAVYIEPVAPTVPEYPQRALLLALIGLFLFLAWSISVLIYYAIRDGR